MKKTLVLMLVACGGGVPMNMNGGGAGGSGGSGGSSGAGGGGGSSSFNFSATCCLNNSFYQCNDKAAFDKCAGFDVGECVDACPQGDFMCMSTCFDKGANATHDPSSCQRDQSKDNTCGSTGNGDICSTAKTTACSYSSQCSTNNCTDGYCRANTVGSACGYSSQCNSNNCTDGCCRGNGKGSKCGYSSQCTSNNCTNGRCQ